MSDTGTGGGLFGKKQVDTGIITVCSCKPIWVPYIKHSEETVAIVVQGGKKGEAIAPQLKKFGQNQNFWASDKKLFRENQSFLNSGKELFGQDEVSQSELTRVNQKLSGIAL